MASSLYDVLGIARSASEDEIRSAYRKLAKASHPDLNPGDKAAEQRFKDIAAAYAILSDASKRQRYDAGEIDESGAERPPERQFYRQYADAGPQFKYETGGDFGRFEDLGGIFADLFSRSGGAQAGDGPGFPARGRDVRYRLAIDFLDAVNGARKRIDLPDGRTLDVRIPPGVAEGQVLRLAGMGTAGTGDMPAGDALVEIGIKPHAVFRREGSTIRSMLPVTLGEALSGASVRVETVSGPVDLKVPPGSNSGQLLRLKGRGVLDPQTARRGDHLVELRVMLPPGGDAELEHLIADWEARHPYNPRSAAGGDA